MKERLDELGARAREETPITPPPVEWLQERRARRVRHRQLLAGVVAVGVGALGVMAVSVMGGSSGERTEAVASTVDPDEGGSSVTPGTPSTAEQPVATVTDTVPSTADGSCGAWPTGFQAWPGQDAPPPVDSNDGEGRAVRRQSNGRYTLEIYWPPLPQPDYDLAYDGPPPSTFWTSTTDQYLDLGINPDGSVGVPQPDSQSVNPSGLVVLRVTSDDPTLSNLQGSCAEFEFHILEGDRLVERVGFGFGSLNEPVTVVDQTGNTVTIDAGPQLDWLQLGPIVVEQRQVAAVPGSVRCDGVLADLDTTAYRVDEPVDQTATLATALASAALVPIADPRAESKVVDPADVWAVLLPDAPRDATISQLSEQGFLHFISASGYEDFIDPETGPTSGPGLEGEFDRPIDALKAFFTHPAARTFIKTGLVELTVDDTTVAYGVPQDEGGNRWITVITVKKGVAGWLVAGWTSAGC